MPSLRPGRQAEVLVTTTRADTAVQLGSGDVPVLATPRLIAWMEAATVAATDGALGPDTTTVGTRVEVDHLAATAIGMRVRVVARLVEVDDRRLGFDVEATDEEGNTVGRGTIRRVVVDRRRFLDRLGGGEG